MGDYVPLYVSLGLLFLFGVLYPSIYGTFYDLDLQHDNILAPLVDVIDNGFTVDLWFYEVTLNPFDNLGQTFQDYLLNVVIALTYLPPYVIIPLMIVIIFGFLYTIIKLLPTT